MAQFRPLILKLGKKAQAIIGDVLRFPDHVIFDQQINIGTSADETVGNIKHNGTDILGRLSSGWKSLTKTNYSDVTEVESSVSTQTNSTSFVVLSGFTTVPPAGRYKIEVNLDVKMTGTFCVSEFGLYNNNTLIPNTFRGFGGDSPLGTVTITKIFVADGTNPIQIKYRTLNSSRVVTVGARIMILTKMN